MELNGVLLGKGEYDWVAGGNSAIRPEVLVPNKNWKPFSVEHEIQFNVRSSFDTLFCVTYSSLKSIAKLLTYLEKNGWISAEDLEFLDQYKKDRMYNFSERFIGTLGETTANGAYQYKIANAIKNYGLIPQSMFELADNFQDNIDKKFITQAMYDKGEEFKKRFFINYEWVESFSESLKYSPVQTIVKFSNYEKETDVLKPDGALNHAVCGVYVTPEYNEIDDTYWQRYKRYHPDYTHSYMAFYITINKTTMNTEKFVKDNDKKWVRNSNTGAFGRILQGKLFVAQTQDRATLMLLDDKVREDGVQIIDADWQALPKENF